MAQRLPTKPSTVGVKSLIAKLSLDVHAIANVLKLILPAEVTNKRFSTDTSLNSLLELLESFCVHPDQDVFMEVVNRSLTILETSSSLGEIYGILAAIFYSCRKPLLTLEYLTYAKVISPTSPLIQELDKKLREYLSWHPI